MLPIKIITFYRFFDLLSIDTLENIKTVLLDFMTEHNIKGTIIIANEGYNSTLSGTHADIDLFIEFFNNLMQQDKLDYKESFARERPFKKSKIKIKPEIVTFRQPNADPNRKVGTYLSATEWNKLIQDPDVVVLDSRNDYEYEVGTFKNAINPDIDNFCELADYISVNLDPKKHKKIATFCTGGIRCERLTSYMLNQGFEEVYHLEGGILRYLQEVAPTENLWEGECFVFDERRIYS